YVNRKHTKVVCTLFDLIPLIFADQYLVDSAAHEIYMRRLALYKSADLVLAISENSRQDAIRLLQLAPEQVINVGAGVDPVFQRLPAADRDVAFDPIKQELGLQKGYVLYTGGYDYRKNLQGMIEAFSLL